MESRSDCGKLSCVDPDLETREGLQILWARLGRPGPVSPKRLQTELDWSREKLSAVLAAAAREKVLEIASERALPKDGLAREAARNFRRCYSAAKIEKLIAALTRDGLLRKAVKVIGQSTLYYRTGVVEPLVRAFRERLERLGFPAEEIDRAFKPTLGQHPAQAELPAYLLDQLRALEEQPGVPVTVHRLRAAFPGVSKADFDRAVLSLADRGQVFLLQRRGRWHRMGGARGRRAGNSRRTIQRNSAGSPRPDPGPSRPVLAAIRTRRRRQDAPAPAAAAGARGPDSFAHRFLVGLDGNQSGDDLALSAPQFCFRSCLAPVG